MPKYTYAQELQTFYYTTVEAPNEKEAERIAQENFFNFENMEEGDAEWRVDSLELIEEDEEDE